ncbi:hypothetical protein ECNE037_5877, partial [Escherichia coli NE037]
MVITAAMATWA